ncbi:MAG: NAD-dependent DNA ligase LigA [Deltaproteobacteria bacterium]|nr:NAD-dependent DNA ligase LigA [Deltaproteobacteria bacterium]
MASPTSSPTPAPAPPAPPAPPDKPVESMSPDELATAIRFHNHRYFVLHDPVISDYAFDRIVRRLRALAPEHPALAELTPEGGTGELRTHDTPMLSLEKAYSETEVLEWSRTFVGDVVEAPKIDGIAASLKYDAQGRLVSAVTRGDGVQGEVFTPNARFVRSVPKDLGEGPVEIRGEVYLPLSVFRRKFAGQFANPRNTAAGAIKQKEPHKTADYELEFFAYGVRGRDFAKLTDGLAWAAARGVRCVPHALVDRSAIGAGHAAWLADRERADCELDGVVYTADLTSEQRRLGETSHHPRWAIAFKFQGESARSTIVDIEWSVSRSGAITPIAVIAPVFLSGAEVSRCSLHNLAILAKLGAGIGAEVVASRRGGVIPHIESVVTPGPEVARPPERCPASGHPTVVDGDVLMCSEPHHCPAARLGTLEHWLKSVDIDGFGPKVLAKLVERDWVSEPADFYRLTVDQLETLDRLGRKSAQNLVDAVQAKRRLPLATLLASLGVDTLGWVAAQKVARTFGALDRVMAASEAEIATIHGLGETTARLIRAGLDRRRDIIDALAEVVTIEDHAPEADPATGGAEIVIDPNDPIAGKSFVFTGKLEAFDRKTAQSIVKSRGGTTPDDVSKTLDYLVVGGDELAESGAGKKSGKLKKAEKLAQDAGRPAIISEAEFKALAGLT